MSGLFYALICYCCALLKPATGRYVSQLFQELKRRNVFRVGLAYLAVAWLDVAGRRHRIGEHQRA